MPEIIACDVSYFQLPVDNSYPHKWLIFRCCDGGFLDPHAAQNVAWSRAAVKSGRMLGWTTYVVYRPGQNTAVLANLARVGFDGRVMIDVESWGGQIRGDHSGEITVLANAIAAKAGSARVWVYGNASDLAAIYPTRPAWLKVVLASWGGTNRKPDYPNLIGWQYTDGEANFNVPGLPSSTPPFGACDHNVLYITETAEGVGTEIKKPPTSEEDDDMKSFLARIPTNPNTFWLVRGDMTERVQITAAVAKNLQASGRYESNPGLDNTTITNIPIAKR